MGSITQFKLNKASKVLSIEFEVLPTLNFSMEFLRVIDPSAVAQNPSNKAAPVVSNKKQVLLIAVESIGKHGYRLVFDDGFQKLVDESTFLLLNQNEASLWQDYLEAIKESGFTREATIEIKSL